MEILLTEIIDLEKMADLCAIGFERKPPTPRDHDLWHVSNLLKSAKLITKGDVRYHEFEGLPSGIMSMGRIWEASVDCYLDDFARSKDGFYLPDCEKVKDNILGSLDGIICLPEFGFMVSESKLRFTLNPEIPMDHLQQVRAYCYLSDTDTVCYTSGHISSAPPTMQATIQILRFTKQAIRETWEGIVNTRAYLLKCGCHPGVAK